MLLLGAENVDASMQFYLRRGFGSAGAFTDPDGFAWEPAAA
ncbi:hypothetical protein [Agromyces albus]|nr:hypothetical protein [Agromyces albus]